ncbi:MULTISPECIES: phosphoenolpyruvate--protein phosphotransferase [Sutterella]|uniref:phosphoenolpyruvate--protein phosphotransferase n=1 Tax=Sutterella TaxID=40544 RepID=UPI001F2BA225|nr:MULTISPECIES: phosphoenolpyruvate--protein phosphotransferase [Sutterella]MDR3929176.1 phosphoenolpyruvate--protein phosphotransferase [Sutterella sp.]MDR3966686.1 phosphoenolpyruvate--protein phosphotransferase [Sutterella sp.]
MTGLKVCPGVAWGLTLQLTSSDLEIHQFAIDKSAVRGEIQRLRMATASANKQLEQLAETLDEDAPAEASAFLDVYQTILQDPSLITETADIIREKLVNAEWALSLRLEQIRRDFEQIDDDYLRNRLEDISGVFQRIQRVLAGRRSAASLLKAEEFDDSFILIADQLGPADMLQLRERDDLDIVGIIMETGSVTSHSAILAASLGIPTLVGVTNAIERLGTGREILIDATAGTVKVAPSPEEKKAAAAAMKSLRQRKRLLQKLRDEMPVTTDGHSVRLYANIALPEDMPDARKAGANGIGLFRTEFLFLNRDALPDEEEQVSAYQKVIRGMRGKTVTIRTADLGGDKMPSKEALALLGEDEFDEENPALGLRGLRFAFTHRPFFITQLRAIMRAATSAPEGTVRILLPMVTSASDVTEVRLCLAQAAAELDSENLKYEQNLPLGGMIELPAAVASIGDLVQILDFFSIGTNDLVQYTLAVDRTNARVSRWWEECHPAVLRLIAQTVKRVREAGKGISVCGEMASRLNMAPFFIGIGCSALSMDAAHIPAMKECVRKLSAESCEDFARGLLRRRSTESIREAIDGYALTLLSSSTEKLAERTHSKST